MSNNYSFWIYALGFLAQGFFSARIIIQWLISEKSKKVESPAAYWICSIIGSYLFFCYGWLRNDFAIILGQFISYYIYLWNLHVKGLWKKAHVIIRAILLITPIVAITKIGSNFNGFISEFIQNDEVPLWLLLFGSAGQIIFTLRFIYQWFYSRRHNESILPAGFWIISLIGSAVIVSYAFIRRDPVLAIGQSVGFIAYTRNLFIGKKHKMEQERQKNNTALNEQA